MAKNNLLERFTTSARAEVAQIALCVSNCEMPTSAPTPTQQQPSTAPKTSSVQIHEFYASWIWGT